MGEALITRRGGGDIDGLSFVNTINSSGQTYNPYYRFSSSVSANRLNAGSSASFSHELYLGPNSSNSIPATTEVEWVYFVAYENDSYPMYHLSALLYPNEPKTFDADGLEITLNLTIISDNTWRVHATYVNNTSSNRYWEGPCITIVKVKQ